MILAPTPVSLITDVVAAGGGEVVVVVLVPLSVPAAESSTPAVEVEDGGSVTVLELELESSTLTGLQLVVPTTVPFPRSVISTETQLSVATLPSPNVMVVGKVDWVTEAKPTVLVATGTHLTTATNERIATLERANFIVVLYSKKIQEAKLEREFLLLRVVYEWVKL